MEDLRGKVALVTGGSGGIGGALSRRLAAEGCHVAVGYGANREAAEALAERLSSAGAESGDECARAIAVGGDLTDPAVPGILVDAVERELGPIDILVANAGYASVLELEDISLEEWRHTVDVNLTAPFLLAQRVAPGMRDRGWGRILMVSSIAAFTGGVIGAHYASSKAGLLGLTHYLAGRLARSGVTVNALAPALIEDTAMLPGDPAELGRRIPVGRVGRPDEVADLALAVLRNPYVTNQAIGIDGGMHPR
jgi:3-oxoacyl-[acyl-carrier protein] reductase